MTACSSSRSLPETRHLLLHDLRLHFKLGVFDDFDKGLRVLFVDADPQRNLLPGSPAGSLFYGAVFQRLEMDSALDEFVLKDVDDALQRKLVERADGHDLFFLVKIDRRLGIFQVIALRDFLLRLIEGIVNFLHVHFGNDVERILLCHRLSVVLRLNVDVSFFQFGD